MSTQGCGHSCYGIPPHHLWRKTPRSRGVSLPTPPGAHAQNKRHIPTRQKKLINTLSTQINALTDQRNNLCNVAGSLNNVTKHDKSIRMLLDSGANFFAFHLDDYHMRLLPQHTKIQAFQPDGDSIHSIAKETLDDFLPRLPEGTCNGHIIPLPKHSIAPCSKLFDTGCCIELNQDRVNVIYKDRVIIKGD